MVMESEAKLLYLEPVHSSVRLRCEAGPLAAAQIPHYQAILLLRHHPPSSAQLPSLREHMLAGRNL